MSAEAKVGAIFVAFVVLATVVGLYLGGVWGRLGTYDIYVRFSDAGAVEPGANVMMSGVKVGQVAAVELRPDPAKWPGKPVLMRLAIKRGVEIPADYRFRIAQGGLLAMRYVSIEPRRRRGKQARFLAPGEVVEGAELAGFASLDRTLEQTGGKIPEVLNAVQDTLRTVQETVNQLGGRAETVLLSSERERQIDAIMRNIAQLTAAANRAALRAERLAAVLARTAERSSPDVEAMVRELRAASENVRAAAEQINRLVATTPLPADLAAAGQSIRRTAAAAEETAGAIRDVLASEEGRKRLDAMVSNLSEASAKLNKLVDAAQRLIGDEQMAADARATVRNIREATASLKRTSAHIEQLLTDEEVTQDLRATITSARQAAERGAQVVGKVDQSLDRVNTTMDRLSDTVQSVRPAEVRGQLDAMAFESSGLRADLDFDLFYGARRRVFWRLGVADVGDAERLNLQRGFPIGRGMWMRAGIFANKAGLGLDFQPPGSAWSAEVELWDPEETYLDVSIFRRLHRDWWLGVGVHGLFDENEALLTVRRSFHAAGEREKKQTTSRQGE